MNIFLDSNIIIKDPYLQGSRSVLFLKNYRKAGFKCYISQITFEEVCSNYKKLLIQKVERFNSALNSLNQLVETKQKKISEALIEKNCNEYRSQLTLLLSVYRIKVLPVPEISHNKILHHLFAGKHPFDNKDNGYKDFLIYNTILKLIRTKKENAILVSEDNDFGDQFLNNDLIELNKTPYEIKLVKSLDDILQNELIKKQIGISNAQNAFMIDIFKEQVHENNYIEAIVDQLENIEINIHASDLLQDIDFYKNPLLGYAKFLSDTGRIISINSLDRKFALVEFEIKAYLVFIVSIRNRNIYQLAKLPNDIDLNLIDQDNNFSTYDIGYWYFLNIKSQSDINGNNLRHFEIEIVEN